MPIEQLTLFVPELIWPEPEDSAALAPFDTPCLEQLLARAHRERHPAQPMETTLTQLFGRGDNAPLSALRLLGEHGMTVDAGTCCWIAADPVHLRNHQESLILADGDHIGIADEEALALIEGLNTYFSDLGRFYAATGGRWYLQRTGPTAALDNMAAPPLSTVAGRRIDALLPEVVHDRDARKLFNEIQTYLHAHPVNQKREDEGRMTVNSLWLWGAGEAPERAESDFDGVWSTLPLTYGLARLAGVPIHPQPVHADTLFMHAASETNHLVVLENLLGPVQYENAEAYRTALTKLETNWFIPLRDALAAGTLGQLQLVATTAYGTLGWDIRRSDAWKFWRPRQTLAALAKSLATGAP